MMMGTPCVGYNAGRFLRSVAGEWMWLRTGRVGRDVLIAPCSVAAHEVLARTVWQGVC